MLRFLLIPLIILLSYERAIADSILSQMNGSWRSQRFNLVIDTERMQGSWMLDKPFQRDALRIRNVVGRMVVFDIGSKSFIGLFEREQLKLSDLEVGETITLSRHKH